MEDFVIPRTRKLLPMPVVWNLLSQTSPQNFELFGDSLSCGWQCYMNGEQASLYPKSEWKRVGIHVKEKIIQEPNFINELFKRQNVLGNDLKQLSTKILGEKLDTLDIQELLERYKEVQKYWLNYDIHNVTPWFIAGDFLEDHLKSGLKKTGLSETEMVSLVNPSQLSFSTAEESEVLSIVLRKKNGEIAQNEMEKQLNELENKYFWIPFGYNGPEKHTFDYYRKLVDEIAISRTTQDIENRINEISQHTQNITSIKKGIIKKYNVPYELQRLVADLDTLSVMTDVRKEYEFIAHVALDAILRAIAHKILIDHIVLKFVLFDELKESIGQPDKLNEIYTERQSKITAFKAKGGKLTIEDDKTAKTLANIAFPQLDDGIDSFQGISASKGSQSILKGRVQVLRSPSEVKNFEKERILIADMTTPEYVPAMRNALAIITDEGGVTCHAAIVSRELKKPCIIGTKIATKILRDGMLVEVDANKGIVRILRD